ncbi:hypothetical protein L7F22_034960 [Adiantum nelumboides]|nr:hypothetical protein [Adiantum nelumboides]
MGDAIAPVVTPSPFTPAVLPTPGPLPRYKDQFTEEAEEWGVDGYGSMNGLIRMKATNMNNGPLIAADDEEDDVEEYDRDEKDNGHYAQSLQQLEQRLDQGLNRFEMVYPCMLDAKQAPTLQVELTTMTPVKWCQKEHRHKFPRVYLTGMCSGEATAFVSRECGRERMDARNLRRLSSVHKCSSDA